MDAPSGGVTLLVAAPARNSLVCTWAWAVNPVRNRAAGTSHPKRCMKCFPCKRDEPHQDARNPKGNPTLRGDSLHQRADFHFAEEDFRGLRLELNLAFGVAGLGAGVNDMAVENRGDAVAVAHDFEAVPFSVGAFDVARAAIAQRVGPIGIAAPPVDTPAAFHDRLAAGFEENLLAIDAGLHGKTRRGFAPDDDEVAHAALDELHFDRLEPVPAVRAVL